ncbi:MAG TPA: PHP domain-containing protein [Thermotogota bacterium]|nr:PHP domain-containing protein [Thermotogota bacterium]
MSSVKKERRSADQKISIDLHLHTHFSDGRHSAEELFRLISTENVSICSVTDHDTIEHIPEIQTEAKAVGLAFLPGVEISTFFEGGEVHILGYGYSLDHPVFSRFLRERFANRTERVREMIALLNRIGIGISYEDVQSQSPGPYVGRPNIARAMKSKGYIKEISEAFTRSYIGAGGRAYVPPSECHPREAIEAIRTAGGVAVLAHPGLYYSEEKWRGEELRNGLNQEQISQMRAYGLEGIECYHTKHSFSDSQKYTRICKHLGCIQTMGSDFHEGAYFPIHWQVPQPVLEETYRWLRNRFSCSLP